MEIEPTDEVPVFKKKRSYIKILAIVVLCLAVIGIVIGMITTPVLIWLTFRYNSQRFDKLENMIRAAHPELAKLEPANIHLPSNAPFLGSKDAKVTIIEYADFQCPFCKEFQDKVFPELKTKYIDTGKANFYFQDFSFLGDESQAAAEAAKCAQDQDKFWQYHDLLYASQKQENSGAFSADNLKKFATTLGLDSTKFTTCVDSHIYKTDVEAETQSGQNYNVTATPTVFINGIRKEGVGTIGDFSTAIDAALAK